MRSMTASTARLSASVVRRVGSGSGLEPPSVGLRSTFCPPPPRSLPMPDWQAEAAQEQNEHHDNGRELRQDADEIEHDLRGSLRRSVRRAYPQQADEQDGEAD